MDFWNEYYDNKIDGDNILISNNSTFATYILNYITQSSKTLIDLGCGNGRDSTFFEKTGLKVTSVDMSQEALDRIGSNSITKVCSSMDSIIDFKDRFDVCYTRFSLHSITLEQQNKVLDWVSKNINKDGLFCIETRSINDPRFGKGEKLDNNGFIDTHYRRFTELSTLTKDLKSRGFKIIKAEEEWFDANYKEDKAVVVRIIALKN